LPHDARGPVSWPEGILISYSEAQLPEAVRLAGANAFIVSLDRDSGEQLVFGNVLDLRCLTDESASQYLQTGSRSLSVSSNCDAILERLGDWTIERNSHVFAAWAAGNAGRLPIKGPKVFRAQCWLAKAGFNEQFSVPSVSEPDDMDSLHRCWRDELISAAKSDGYGLSHGRAAKFINVYNKARFLRPEVADQSPYSLLHPPIDSRLIAVIKGNLSGSSLRTFRTLTNRPWSQFDSEQYEELITVLRSWMNGLPFWKLEALWPGAR
jgi:hypothetical protein